jgi:hypothetical protein
MRDTIIAPPKEQETIHSGFTSDLIGGIMRHSDRPQKISFAEMRNMGRARRADLSFGLQVQPLDRGQRRS